MGMRTGMVIGNRNDGNRYNGNKEWERGMGNGQWVTCNWERGTCNWERGTRNGERGTSKVVLFVNYND